MGKNTEKRPELGEKELVRLTYECFLKKREEKLRKIIELLGKRESLMILKLNRSEGFSQNYQ